MREGTGLDVWHLQPVLARIHAALAAYRTHIDDLNVFPVPDGDTGTNMLMTVREALDAATAEADAEPDELCRLLIRASMRGARGNSGVILSQVLRALIETVAERGEGLDTAGYASFLDRSRDLAYEAVADPIEGTILTVIGAAAQMGHVALDEGSDLAETSASVCTAVHAAVGRTPDQLAVLREAGVVDAGARGFEVVVEALHAHIIGAPFDDQVPPPPHVRRGDGELAVREAGALHFRFEVQYLLDADDGSAGPLRDALETIGDSVVVVSAGGLTTVHVHTNDVGGAIELGLGFGKPSRIEVTYFADRASERQSFLDERQRVEDVEAAKRMVLPQRRLGCVVVLPGPGLGRLAEEMAATVVEGGAGSLPSVADLLNAIGAVRAERIAILPGHRNAVPTANQASDVSVAEGGRTLDVVESADSPTAVLAALAVCDPDADPEDVLADMEDAAAGVRTAEVVAAVRDAATPIGAVRQGQLLAVVEGRVDGAHEDPLDALRAAIEGARGGGSCEAITLVVGAEVDDGEAARAEGIAIEIGGEVEVQVIRGDQRPVRYFVGVE